ncbi:hypothetical protein IQ227_18960 [Anabaena aphanizomenioides LEGE 00250]|uniref:Uncharacterized protein n=1 Tax=Sphaerospermopsis aphanizomenoides LEGE 00250 TaxID=2777972 RepID=A0ABR9VHS8_9CYAN|nr:hypothetical protein [Sphaerospermopsis aphanizomenoides]MBE9238048.1 hypothetical protein [Sphaerospermopsis aphanizomenoides LEGE 00250]
MKFDALSLQKFLMGECEPLETLSWLSDIFLPEIVSRLNTNDVRQRLGIYAGEKIPENERNLTDVRNRVSLILEYELARVATLILEDHGIQNLFWCYVVANRFPDLEVRTISGERGLRVEVKCLQSIAEEKSANFDTLKKDIHPKTDFVVVFLWEWKYDSQEIKWDRSPFVHKAFVFHASSLAYLRDWYWLNNPPKDLGNGFQGFDLRYAVNCKNGIYNQEEGNYGKLLRIWQQDFQYQPPNSDIIYRTIENYFFFKKIVIMEGFNNLAHLILPRLSESNEISPILYKDKDTHEEYEVGWQSKNICFILNSFFTKNKNDILQQISENKGSKIYTFTDKYVSTEYNLDGSNIMKINQFRKPKFLIQGLIEN